MKQTIQQCGTMTTDRKEDPVIFYQFPGTLQGMAASTVALHCWRHEVSNLYSDENISKHRVYINDYTLPLPTQIIDLINRLIESLPSKFQNWWNYHGILHFDCPPQFLDFLRMDCLSRIVCKSNGNADICYVRTAANLLNSNQLSLVQKYRLACMYRFNHHVKNLWPSVKNTPKIIHPKYVVIPLSPKMEWYGQLLMMKFWDYHAGYKIDRLDVQFELDDVKKYNNLFSFISTMFRQNNYMHPKMKVEQSSLLFQSQEMIKDVICYLLDYTIDGRPPPRFNELMNDRHEWERLEITKYLLPKLNSTHLKGVLLNFPTEIITYLAREEEYYLHVLRFWSCIKDSVGKNEFFNILCILSQMAYSCNVCPHYHHIATLLCDVFIAAPDDLKNHIVNNHVGKFFNDLPDYYRENNLIKYGSNVEFLFQLLERSRFDVRKELWLRNWYKLILLMEASNLNRLMNLCYDNDNEILECKRDLERSCSSTVPCIYNVFVESGFCSELINLLKCIIPSNDEVMLMTRGRIISMNMSKMPMLNSNAVVRFSAFIDDTFRSIDLAKQFKEEYVMKNTDWLCNQIDKGHLIGVKNTINCLISSKRRKNELKKIFYEYYKNVLVAANFTEFCIRQCEEFLLWCAPNQVELFRFKKSLNEVDIFQHFVNELKSLLVKDDESGFVFYSNQCKNFLQWFFVYDNFRMDFVEIMLDNLQGDNYDDEFKSILKLHLY